MGTSINRIFKQTVGREVRLSYDSGWGEMMKGWMTLLCIDQRGVHRPHYLWYEGRFEGEWDMKGDLMVGLVKREMSWITWDGLNVVSLVRTDDQITQLTEIHRHQRDIWEGDKLGLGWDEKWLRTDGWEIELLCEMIRSVRDEWFDRERERNTNLAGWVLRTLSKNGNRLVEASCLREVVLRLRLRDGEERVSEGKSSRSRRVEGVWCEWWGADMVIWSEWFWFW